MSTPEIQKDMRDLMRDHLGIWPMTPLERCCAALRVVEDSHTIRRQEVQEKFQKVAQNQMSLRGKDLETALRGSQAALKDLAEDLKKVEIDYVSSKIRILERAVREGVDDPATGHGPYVLRSLKERAAGDAKQARPALQTSGVESTPPVSGQVSAPERRLSSGEAKWTLVEASALVSALEIFQPRESPSHSPTEHEFQLPGWLFSSRPIGS